MSVVEREIAIVVAAHQLRKRLFDLLRDEAHLPARGEVLIGEGVAPVLVGDAAQGEHGVEGVVQRGDSGLVAGIGAVVGAGRVDRAVEIAGVVAGAGAVHAVVAGADAARSDPGAADSVDAGAVGCRREPVDAPVVVNRAVHIERVDRRERADADIAARAVEHQVHGAACTIVVAVDKGVTGTAALDKDAGGRIHRVRAGGTRHPHASVEEAAACGPHGEGVVARRVCGDEGVAVV